MSSPWSGKRLLRVASIFVPALLLGLLAWRHRWVADDGFIDFRVVENLLHGSGPVFNPGERVEAFTSPAWVALLALGGLIVELLGGGLPLEWISVACGIACGVAAMIFAALGAEELQGEAGGEWAALPVPFGALVVLAVIPFWDYCSSGLETSLVFLWLAVAFFACARLRRSSSGRGRLAAGLWIGFGPLVRPDLGIFGLIFGGIALLEAEGTRRRLELLSAMLVLPVAYQLFRMGYYASLIPNTAIAKEAGLAYWSHGGVYFLEVEKTYQLWLPGLLLVASQLWLLSRGDPGSRLLIGGTMLGAALYGLYIVRVGGDFLHARLLLPAVFALALPVFTVRFRIFRWLGSTMVPWAAACFLYATIPLDNDRAGIERGRPNFVKLAKNEHPVTLDDYRQDGWVTDVDRLFEKADEIRRGDPKFAQATFYSASGSGKLRTAKLRPSVEAEIVAFRGAVGMFGYKAGPKVFVCDYHGLADPIAARLSLVTLGRDNAWHLDRGKPGHEKRMRSDWCVARTTESIEERPPGKNAIAAWAALGCGDLAELMAAVDEPLSWSRFWSNVVLAPRLTRLRIPQDVFQARAEFCG